MLNRHENMLKLIKLNEQMSFAELKKAFSDVSEMTIRRDIDQLEHEKKVLRVPGGVKSIESVVDFIEDRYALRSIENLEFKKEIALKAVSLIKPRMCIFLDSGSTTTAFAHLFPDIECLVYTTGLTCAIELSKLKKVKTVMLGGWVNKNSLSTYGSIETLGLNCLNFNLSFVGVTGFDEKAGFTTGISDEASIKQIASQRSKQRVVLMDSLKIGHILPCTFAEPKDVDIVISDSNIDLKTKKYFEFHGVTLL